jgi:hypothetical protein
VAALLDPHRGGKRRIGSARRLIGKLFLAAGRRRTAHDGSVDFAGFAEKISGELGQNGSSCSMLTRRPSVAMI